MGLSASYSRCTATSTISFSEPSSEHVTPWRSEVTVTKVSLADTYLAGRFRCSALWW